MEGVRQKVEQIDESQRTLISDANMASVDGLDVIVANQGQIYNYQELDELANEARRILRIVDQIKRTYDRDEFDRMILAINTDRYKRLDERDEELRAKRLAKLKAVKADVFVYLMFNERTGHYKIGYSKEPKHREKTLQADDPLVSLFAAYPGKKSDERRFHKLFAEKRGRGEWFTLTPEDIKLFQDYFK